MKIYYYFKDQYDQQYGPMSLDELRSRLDSAQTLVKRIADGSDWQPASSWPELQDLFPPIEAAAPQEQTPRAGSKPPPIPQQANLTRNYDEESPLDSQGFVQNKAYNLILYGNIAALVSVFLCCNPLGLVGGLGLYFALDANNKLQAGQTWEAENRLKWGRIMLYINGAVLALYILYFIGMFLLIVLSF